MTDTDILIIGGGLAGLSLAAHLSRQQRNILVVEARSRLGGRILTQSHGSAAFDMGPAWFWPGQPRIAALIADLGLASFDQHATGDLMFEDARGQPQRGRGLASMQGSYRLRGGLGALIDGLTDRLDPQCILRNTVVAKIHKTDDGVRVETTDGQSYTAGHVVLCLPPRIAAGLTFLPDIGPGARRAMESIPTWMAGQAKAIAIYDEAFWRQAGLSGDAMSRRGPLVEIHDATPDTEEVFALFGFIGVPPAHRKDHDALQAAVLDQLVRLFGQRAATPVAIHIKDWAFDPFTATEADQQPVHAHPHYGLPDALVRLWDGRVIFGGTEVASQFGGYLEGALEAAESALGTLDRVAA